MKKGQILESLKTKHRFQVIRVSPTGNVTMGGITCEDIRVCGPKRLSRKYRVWGYSPHNLCMVEQLYVYVWGSYRSVESIFRMKVKGRKCRLLTIGTMRSCMIEFIDNGYRLITSINAIRKISYGAK